MCGFSVVLSKKKINERIFKKINRKIKHRGPDKEKYFSSSKLKKKIGFNFFFGFNRLKILDLNSRADQPFFYNNKYILLFNGEIYNYLELKNYLQKKKYKFKTSSDTEVIAAAYDFWGEYCFNKFHGMWSIIIYNIKTKQFCICRDRFGVKPLYYLKNNKGEIVFASEIKQLLSLIQKREINHSILNDYLKYDFQNHTSETFFKNIFQIDKGCLMKIDENMKILNKRWYNFKIQKNNNDEKKLEKLLIKSILLRLRSDTKISLSLSGGIDSTSIASIIANIEKKDYKKIYTFSSITGDENDESKYINSFNQKYRFKNIKVKLDFASFKKYLPKILSTHDEPIPNLTIFTEWMIFKKIKQFGIKVNIDGHAADEIFCGYEKYFSLNIINQFFKLKFFSIIVFFLRIFTEKDIVNKKKYILRILGNIFNLSLIKKFYLNSFNEKWIIKKHKSQFIRKKYSNDRVLNENYNQFFYTSLPKQLKWSDLNSMRHSIETRSPFIDHDIVENFLFAKSEKKLKDHYSKYILRNAVKKYLPINIFNRKFKVGFSAPEHKWLTKNRKFVKQLFLNSFKICNQILDQKCKIEGVKIINGKKNYNGWIWKIIFLGLWIKKYKVCV